MNMMKLDTSLEITEIIEVDEGTNGTMEYACKKDECLFKESREKCQKYCFNDKHFMDCSVKLVDISKHPGLIKQTKAKDVYEVEKVLGKKTENNKSYYLIKWKSWGMIYNTWEPTENLTNCPDLLKDFENVRTNILQKFQKQENFYPSVSDMELYMQKLFSKNKTIDVSFAETDKLYQRISQFLSLGPEKFTKSLSKIKEKILQMYLYNARNEQLSSLEDWETEMNNIAKSKPLIKVENVVDLERAPQEFLYIDDYLPGCGVIIPEDPPIGCECTVCDSKTSCCYAQCDGNLPYTSACRIRVPPGTPIYECNKRCTCLPDCQNRVVQRGSQMKLCVFRTSNGRGWGVKTLRVIKKGTFVIQYVGEVITNEEAESRGKKYDAAGRTYLFDLDYNETEGQCPYTVDAAVYGNISHFINHSCDPNLAVYAVWINCLDPNLPKLALFATRDIKQNEEITFDYMCQSREDRNKKSQTSENNVKESKDKKVECKCGTESCRKYLF